MDSAVRADARTGRKSLLWLGGRTDAVTVDEETGVVSITAGLPVGDLTVVFAVWGEGGELALFTMSLRVEDSAALVTEYGNGMFVIGGSDGVVRNDVWRSSDGENWVSVPVSGWAFFWAAGSSGGFLWWESLGDWGAGR